MQLLGQLLGGEHQRVEHVYRFVERLRHEQLGGWRRRTGRAIVVAAGNAMRERPHRTEPGQHIGAGQSRQIAEPMQPESVQQIDQFARDPGNIAQRSHW